MSKASDYIVGVDLGQSQDFTAICVLERSYVDTGKRIEREAEVQSWGGYEGAKYPYPRTVIKPVYERHYAVRHLERLPSGTPYPKQVDRVRDLALRLTKRREKPPRLVVDQTGVGRPVTDLLRGTGLSPVAITITGGDSVSREGRDYRVPKRDLVSAVQVLLQSKRLKIASSLPEAQTLTSELLAFKVSISLKGHDSYGNDVGPWRENPHDDLVLAVALACWDGERYPRPDTLALS